MTHRPLNVVRLPGDRVRFEYHVDQRYIRRIVSLDKLTLFLTGEIEPNHNLASGAAPIDVAKFLNEAYLPRCARPRLPNDQSYAAEVDLVKALTRSLGTLTLHEITSRDAETHKARRLEQGITNGTLKKELRCLRRALDYAVCLGLIRENLLPPIKGLPSRSRRDIWLRKAEIEKLLASCPDSIRKYVELLILTGARTGESLLLERGDWDSERGILHMPTEKQRCPARKSMRELNVHNLCPRLKQLLDSISPHPKTGYLFHWPDGHPLRYDWVNRQFLDARKKAGLDHVHMHDLRGTYTMHRAMVVSNFYQLRAELGHRDAQSIQSYLDRAQRFNPEESIFYLPKPQPCPVGV